MEGLIRADLVPAGSDVSAGTDQCTQCGYSLDVHSSKHLPPRPRCSNGSQNTITGDSVNDPYPDRKQRQRGAAP